MAPFHVVFVRNSSELWNILIFHYISLVRWTWKCCIGSQARTCWASVNFPQHLLEYFNENTQVWHQNICTYLPAKGLSLKSVTYLCPIFSSQMTFEVDTGLKTSSTAEVKNYDYLSELGLYEKKTVSYKVWHCVVPHILIWAPLICF